jgi:glucan phosphoethanolaminetransferase (alkaline phosphatase superfamily)
MISIQQRIIPTQFLFFIKKDRERVGRRCNTLVNLDIEKMQNHFILKRLVFSANLLICLFSSFVIVYQNISNFENESNLLLKISFIVLLIAAHIIYLTSYKIKYVVICFIYLSCSICPVYYLINDIYHMGIYNYLNLLTEMTMGGYYYPFLNLLFAVWLIFMTLYSYLIAKDTVDTLAGAVTPK